MKGLVIVVSFLSGLSNIAFTFGQFNVWDKDGAMAMPKPEPAEAVVYEDSDREQIDQLIFESLI